MTLTPTAIESALGFETDEVWLVLIKIEHSSLAQSILVTNNTEDIVSNGETYIGYPFEISLPDDTDQTLGQVKLRIDNIDRSITAAIRTVTGRPTMTISVILASSPDSVVYGPLVMRMRSVEYDAFVVDAEVGFDDVLNQSFPADRFTPVDFPGLF